MQKSIRVFFYCSTKLVAIGMLRWSWRWWDSRGKKMTEGIERKKKKHSSIARLGGLEVRFVSLASSLKNTCKSKKPARDSVDAYKYPVT